MKRDLVSRFDSLDEAHNLFRGASRASINADDVALHATPAVSSERVGRKCARPRVTDRLQIRGGTGTSQSASIRPCLFAPFFRRQDCAWLDNRATGWLCDVGPPEVRALASLTHGSGGRSPTAAAVIRPVATGLRVGVAISDRQGRRAAIVFAGGPIGFTSASCSRERGSPKTVPRPGIAGEPSCSGRRSPGPRSSGRVSGGRA